MESTDKWDLPSSRGYIITHPVSYIASLHSSENMIPPTWTKVSKTAWKDKSVLCGGYGRRMMNTSISSDAPQNFFNPEKVDQPNNRMSSMEASVTRLQKPDPLAASRVLPGGQSMAKALENKLPHSRYRTFVFEKQTYIDPLLTERGREAPIDWGNESRSVIFSSRTETNNNNNNNNNSHSNLLSARNQSRNLTGRDSARMYMAGDTPGRSHRSDLSDQSARSARNAHLFVNKPLH